MACVKLLITDFDGTLVDTFAANCAAYQRAFAEVGCSISEEQYRKCFGYRFERFMREMGIDDSAVAAKIRELKGRYYPEYFDRLIVNRPLLEFMRAFRQGGGLTAIASTARRVNLENALAYMGAKDDFDLILAGEDVKEGKPSPEIYNTVLQRLSVQPVEALIFEDSPVGIASAEAAGVAYVKVNDKFYGYRG